MNLHTSSLTLTGTLPQPERERACDPGNPRQSGVSGRGRAMGEGGRGRASDRTWLRRKARPSTTTVRVRPGSPPSSSPGVAASGSVILILGGSPC